MGVEDPILAMFNGDRSNPMYLQIKISAFEMGTTCDCGAKISSKKSCTKKTCSSTEALSNHVLFPTYSLLSEWKGSYDFERAEGTPRHWAILVDICMIKKHKDLPVAVTGFTSLEEMTMINLTEMFLNEYVGFSWDNVKSGHTIAVLYAQKDTNTGKKNSYPVIKFKIF